MGLLPHYFFFSLPELPRITTIHLHNCRIKFSHIDYLCEIYVLCVLLRGKKINQHLPKIWNTPIYK